MHHQHDRELPTNNVRGRNKECDIKKKQEDYLLKFYRVSPRRRNYLHDLRRAFKFEIFR